MRVLLTTLNAKYIHTNLAIRLLYQLNKHREGLDWKEFTINEAQQPVAEHCAQYDMVAFSCYIWNITQTLQVARLIKALRPEVRILLGGPEVSYEWEDVIARPEVDFIIAGEGETAWHVEKTPPDILHLLSPEYAPETAHSTVLPDLTRKEHRIIGIDSHYRINPAQHGEISHDKQ